MNFYCQQRVETAPLHNLEAVVAAYLKHESKEQERYLQYYRIQKTLANAVFKAATAELPGGGRLSHQWKIPESVLIEAKSALLKVDLSSAKSFDELHRLVARTIGQISGIGELTIYDTTHRIGAYLGLGPEHVYLHAGVRSGAKALGLDCQAAKLPMSALPAAFQRLLPEQTEDCLCIYKEELKAIKRASASEKF